MFRPIYQLYAPSGLIENKAVTNSTRLVLKEAEKHNISWKIIPGTKVIQLTKGEKTVHFYHQIPPTTSALAEFVITNKKITSNMLKEAGISVADGYRVRKSTSEKHKRAIFNSLSKPLVVKPTNGSWGENITLDIQTYQQFTDAITTAFEFAHEATKSVIAEEMFTGTEYRILTTREKVIAILKRVPANVIGDGESTIKQLIKQKNKHPSRQPDVVGPSHLPIRINKKLRQMLEEQHLTLASVPSKDEHIFLRKVSNISRGGDGIDYTDDVHPSVKQIALKTIRAVPGLEFAGIDFMTKDVRAKQTKDSYIIVEINSSPGFDIHDMPYQGKNRHAAKAFLRLLFPEL